QEALREFCSHPNRFDVIVTDLTMPTMTGLELADRIRRVRPDVPIILCSGYAEAVPKEVSQESDITLCLRKPMTSLNLGRAIQRLVRR
ncbi:MAG TPA: response regulator, partial [bacterium]|nr:response regulator [bacterium]